MPKPQGTYLQTQKINRIALRAGQARADMAVRGANAKRNHLTKLDLTSARNTAYRAHDIGSEDTARGAGIRKALGELVEHLDDYRESLDQLADLTAELREPLFEYRAVTSGHKEITVSNAVNIAIVAIGLLMVVERVRGKRSSGP
jgi:hypothetical protein